MSNPLDNYISDREKRAAKTRADDHDLWNTWKTDPGQHTLEPLLKRFDPVIGQRVSMWKAPNVSESAMRAKLQGLAIKAFETYDPNRGAGLNTHVQNTLKRGIRFTHQVQNLAYIPEAKVEKIGPIDKARDTLNEEFGREPTPSEIATHMNLGLPKAKHITPRKVQEIQSQRLVDLFETMPKNENNDSFDPVSFSSPREQEVLSLLRPSLSADQQSVFDHLYGLNGKARTTSTGEIAKKLGRSPSQVSRLKKSIDAQYKRYV
jgi:DNA-directed RNA polymerase specialized sigma subunit